MKNRRINIIVFFLTAFVCLNGYARHTVLREVEVIGTRPLRDIGLDKTLIDSIALKENVALSLADILAYNSSIFVKNSGRATLSTVSFRGTSPSHTQVTWNGLRINNPMLGMTDFSTLPSFFVDKVTLLHGSSSVTETGGALGGVVSLSSVVETSDSTGLGLQYVQGAGSFRTFDEFLRVSWSDGRWSVSTRVSLASSPNDYKYVNRDKKENVYDDAHNIVGQYYPTERNRSGSYLDFNAMQQVGYSSGKGDRIGLDAWYTLSNRELPLLTTDYGNEREFDNRQREQNIRTIASWNRQRNAYSLNISGGYVHSFLAYDYKREVSPDNWAVMTRSRSHVNTIYGKGDFSLYVSPRLLLTAGITAHQHIVDSKDRSVVQSSGSTGTVGYDKARFELSASVSAKWQPVKPLGVSLVLRQEVFGKKTAFVPALFADLMLYKPLCLMLNGSVSKNHRFPSLNDLYFLPGGNPNLRAESGFTYDAGFSMNRTFNSSNTTVLVSGGCGWFDSRIDDWIIWLPTPKGFFSPRNVKKVHAYGVETNAHVMMKLPRGWEAGLNANYSWTPSVNCGEKMSPADKSVGKQLPYVPRHSASLTARLTWHSWSLLYKWIYNSSRFTMSSNDTSLSGRLPDYFMNGVTAQKDILVHPVALQFKLAINNLFNEHYLSVLGHPMPGTNFEFFVTVTL